MSSIYINSFSGEMPRVDARHLPNEAAQIAKGCHFYQGNLSPLKLPKLTGDHVSSNTKTLFKYLNQHWFTWDKHVDAINSPVANDPWQRVYFTGDGYPKVTNNGVFSGANMPAVAFRLGVQAPEVPIIGVVTEDATDEVDPNDDESRYYTHTFVTEQGEEGPPGEASSKIEILYPDEVGTLVTLALSPPNVNASNITHRRIYRTATGGGIADYLLVAEVPISDSTFVDNVTGDRLGAPLETYDYEMPDQNMVGLTAMANGIFAGFMGNTVCFSNAYLPYAWPSDYQMTTEHDIVAIVAMGNSLAVLTEGYPWIFSGVTPESMTGQKLESNQACVSARSAVIVNGTLIYASPDGLVALTGSGAVPLTANGITREQWQTYQPETIEAYFQEGRYLVFYGTLLDSAFIFDPTSADFRHFDVTANCGFNSLIDDALYLCQNGIISRWEDAEGSMQYIWRSKEYRAPDMSYSCARVTGKAVELSGIKIFADNNEILHLLPGDIPNYAFRLPSIRGDRWEFELYGSGEVHSVSIAVSMQEIR
ncbi:hypothetical protein GCM10007978_24300 [Shewanella hanedai]|uniref:Uncharacterized protein n=1 Tax=Shewanella hanedai TaxID=25 RepID=A0A553JN04_SHEHA|nr:hypothetical protein [Shewanella hanedai]TRY13844.1 hypothetical protein FN961_13075 [Shewanella hanedai]GGI85782.1 hypothetical protein GCM10007978_24300 [Shewanella hanedai]